ncbi:hypothetical protein Tco_1326703 [Tanacetum coccineum]
MESDKVIKSSVENLVPIPSEFKGISEDTCNVPVCEDPSTFNAGIVEADFDPNDDTSSDDDSFENIEYVDASPSYSELVSLEKVNDVDQEEKEFDLEDILQIQDVNLRERLLKISRLISNIESLKDKPTPDRVFKSPSPFPIPVADSDSFLEESDTSLSHLDNSLPEFETFSDHTEETRSGKIPEFESFHFDQSFPRPPLEPPDVEINLVIETDVPEINDLDKLNGDECFDQGGGEINFEADNSFTFVTWIFLPFLTYPEVRIRQKSQENRQKTDKHGHGNQKSTKEAKDSKPKPRKVNYGQASVKSSQTVKESQTLVNRSQPLEDKNPNGHHIIKQAHWCKPTWGMPRWKTKSTQMMILTLDSLREKAQGVLTRIAKLAIRYIKLEITPSSKILVKAEASQKRKASTSGATSSHVAKCTRSALAHTSGSTTRPSFFAGDDDESDDDDHACVEILLVTPLCSTDVIPPLGNQGRSSVAPTAEGSNSRDSRGKGIMVDDAVAPSGGVSRQRSSSGPAPSFRDVSGDAIHTNFFPFSAGPYYATYPEDGVAGNCEFTREEWDTPYRPTFEVLTNEVFKDPAICKTIFDQFPTPGEMVRVEGFSDDQLTAKMSVLHCMMMSHGGELLALYRGLNQSHHEYVLSANSRLKGYEEKVANMTGLDNLHAEVARLSAALNQAIILEAERDEEILRLNTTPPEFWSFFRGQFQGLVRKFLASDEFSRVQGELLSSAASAGFERGLSMHQTKDESAAIQCLIPRDTRISPPIATESTVTPVPKSLELSANVAPVSSAVASEQNEEQVNVVVDGSDLEMVDGAAPSKSRGVFGQGTSHVFDDVTEVSVVGSERISSGLTDVVVALSAGEKGDGSTPSSTIEEVFVPPSGV